MAESRRLVFALGALASVMVSGTVGYLVLGFGLLDAVYQTITTVTTVGFREVQPLTAAGKVFTIALIVVGVGTALYTLGVIIETLLEGQLPEVFGRRRMERKITGTSEHVVVCGWGRVGRAIARDLVAMGASTVVVDNDRSVSRTSSIRPCWATPPTTRFSTAPGCDEPGCWSPRSTPTPATCS